MPLLLPLLAFVAGILVSPFLDPSPVWICLVPALLLGWLRRWCALLPVFLMGAALRSLEPPVPPDPGPGPVRLVGTLARAPEWRGIGVYLDVRIDLIDGHPARGRARLTEFLDEPEQNALFRALELGTNDRLEIVVALRRPQVFRNPGVFDYRRYLERQGIYWTGTIRNPRLITTLDRGWHGVDRVKEWIEERVGGHFESDPDVRGLVKGMVLGLKHDLTADTEEKFQAAGLYHLVVVSGFNLAVVAAAAAWVAAFTARKRRSRLAIVLGATLAYAAIVGAQTPVLRAATMVCFLIAGKALDRGYAPLNALAGSAFLILLCDPTSLEDPSFQLTFAAVLTVAGFGAPAARWAFQNLAAALRDFENTDRDAHLPPVIADWRVARRLWCELRGVPYVVVTLPWRVALWSGEAFVVSAAIEAALAYSMVESFFRLSPLSPLLNVPAAFIAAIVTPAGLVLAALPNPLALPVAWVVSKLIRLLLAIVGWTLSLPYASLRVPAAPVWMWIAYFVAIAVTVACVQRRWRGGCVASVGAIALLQGAIAFVDFSPAPPKNIVLTFLDVGQGDSTLLEFPDGRRMLVDGGGVSAGRFLGLRDESTFSIGEDVLSRYLFSRRIRRLDAIVLTHAHNDHIDGLFDVAGNFQVGEAWLGRNPMIPRYRAFLETLWRRRIPVRWVQAGDTIGEIAVLHPPRDWKVRKTAENNDSVVLLLRSGAQTALLTGDLEMPLPSAPDRVNILKVPHHGSRNTRMAVSAGARVISVGANNPFGHPDKSKLPALRTDQLGAITLTIGN